MKRWPRREAREPLSGRGPGRQACGLMAGVLAGVVGWVGVLMAAPAAAEDEARRVIAVDVSGARTVARDTILAKVQTKPGGPYDARVASEDIRRVFALGYFTDVKTTLTERPDGVVVTFVVQEKPAIEEVQLEGHRALPAEKLRELLGVQRGDLYDPRRIKQGVESIQAEYQRRGFSQVEIVWRADGDPAQEGTTLSLLIDEGPRQRIRRVLVEGNQAFSDARVRKLLKTKRRRFFLFGRGVYDAQVLTEDVERVRAFYHDRGYQDATVQHTVYADASGGGLLVHLQITEGLQHRVGDVQVAGTVLFPEREIRRVLAMKPGSVYSPTNLQEDLRRIKEYYGDHGYIHAQVAPEPRLHPDTKRVDLTYHITENELAYVHRIDVRGNLQTKDIVVRRELRIFPGEAFNGEQIRKSVDRLYNLGFFEEVTVDTEPTDQAQHETLVVQIKETKTGTFSFGGGFSSVDRLVGLVELEQRNFDWRNWPKLTGAGQNLRLRVEAGTVRRYFDLSFTEPWWFGHPVSFGFDVYNRTRLRSQNLGFGFEEERHGGGLRFGKEFRDEVQVGLGYQLFRTEISDVVDEASADLKAEQGRADLSVLSTSVAWDRRDNRFDPTQGTYAFLAGDLAGGPMAGDRDFYRAQTGGSVYWPHGEERRFVLEARTRAGVVKGFSDTERVPIFERFFGGGSGTIRGYRERHVGPRDAASNDPIGGEATFLATIEEVMTLVKDERGRPILRGSVFYDVGDVWARAGEFAESFKSGIGLGARVTTPIGPVRLDVGFPLSNVAGEEERARFHFNISRSF